MNLSIKLTIAFRKPNKSFRKEFVFILTVENAWCFLDCTCTLTAGINFDGQKRSEKGRIFLVYLYEVSLVYRVYTIDHCRNIDCFEALNVGRRYDRNQQKN
jgi:hypothetical protein